MKLSKLIQRLQQLQNDVAEDLDVVDVDLTDLKSAYIHEDGSDLCVVLE